MSSFFQAKIVRNFGFFYVFGHAGKMVLPFEPLTISFKDVQYFVDIPPVIIIPMLVVMISCC